MRPFFRAAYLVILQLHPHAFRAEFGDEMLWIFDEESRRGASARLMVDGIRSIVTQNVRPRIRQVETAGPIYREIDSSLPAERFAQATLVTLCCSLSLSLFLSMVVPKVSVSVNGLLYTRVKILSSIPSARP
jgi:hypothetical protein